MSYPALIFSIILSWYLRKISSVVRSHNLSVIISQIELDIYSKCLFRHLLFKVLYVFVMFQRSQTAVVLASMT